jgi:hypothetical protein
MKKHLPNFGIEVDQTVQDWAQAILKNNMPGKGVNWQTTYGITAFPKSFMEAVFRAAMPYEVKVRGEHYGEWDMIDAWIDEHEIDGLWTHNNTYYWFQCEESAMAFKIQFG